MNATTTTNATRQRQQGTGRLVRRILHPSDLASDSRPALALASSLARQLDAELHVLHVEPPPSVGGMATLGAAPAESALQRFLPPLPGIRLVAATRPGSVPADAILAYAAEQDVDLIVMAARRLHTGFGHLFGSVAREVVERGDRPVLTVRHGELFTAGGLRRVLVPIDFSPASREALEAAAEIARSGDGQSGADAELILLHVIEEPSLGRAARPSFRSRERARAAARLTDLAAAVGTGVPTSPQVRAGSPVDEIVRCAAELAVDLVVTQTHASAARRMVSGSVAEEVQRFATAPVLLTKAPHVDDERAGH